MFGFFSWSCFQQRIFFLGFYNNSKLTELSQCGNLEVVLSSSYLVYITLHSDPVFLCVILCSCQNSSFKLQLSSLGLVHLDTFTGQPFMPCDLSSSWTLTHPVFPVVYIWDQLLLHKGVGVYKHICICVYLYICVGSVFCLFGLLQRIFQICHGHLKF